MKILRRKSGKSGFSKWLLLLYALPTRRSSERVSLWRKLKKFGALQIKSSAYILPDSASQYERFQWLAKQIRDGGGEATLIRLSEIEGMSGEKIVQAFRDARARDYAELNRALLRFIRQKRRKTDESFSADIERFHRRFHELQEIDFFDCPAAQNVRMLIQQAERSSKGREKARKILKAEHYRGRVWLTRPRPEIDRVGSAWLVRRFIDSKAKFVFSTQAKSFPNAIPYDMVDVEFTHHADDCTFETLVKRFAIQDKAVQKMAEMIHDADLEDGKFQRNECLGIDRTLKGWARLGCNDAEILRRGFSCFDALYASLR